MTTLLPLLKTADLIHRIFPRQRNDTAQNGRKESLLLNPTRLSSKNNPGILLKLQVHKTWDNKFQYAAGCIALSPDGSVFAIGCRDGHVRLKRTHTGEKLGKISIDGTDVNALLFSRDNKFLFAGTINGLYVISLTVPRPGEPPLRRKKLSLQGGVKSLAESPDGEAISAGSWNSSVWRKRTKTSMDDDSGIWEKTTLIKTQKPLRCIPDNEQDASPFQEEEVISIDYSPDGRLLAASTEESRIFLLDALNGTILSRWRVQGLKANVFFSPQGDSFSAVSDIALWRINLKENQLKKIMNFSRLKGSQEPQYCAHAAPNRETFATGGKGNKVYVITRKGRMLAEIPTEAPPRTLVYWSSKWHMKEVLVVVNGVNNESDTYCSDGHIATYYLQHAS